MPDPLADNKNPNYGGPRHWWACTQGSPRSQPAAQWTRIGTHLLETVFLRPDCASESAGKLLHTLCFISTQTKCKSQGGPGIPGLQTRSVNVPMSSLASGALTKRILYHPTSGQCFENSPPAVSKMWRSKPWLTAPSIFTGAQPNDFTCMPTHSRSFPAGHPCQHNAPCISGQLLAERNLSLTLSGLALTS